MAHTAGGRGMALQTASGLTIFSPASLACVTTYVILEQERWYEREADFVARWLKPGMIAVDTTADLGVHALPMARAVGPEGRAVAYEPDRTTAALLEESKAMNRLPQLTVRRTALAGLDAAAAELGLERLDVLRLGGAAEACAIIAGADKALTRWSPLVMFKVQPGETPDLATADALRARGCGLFRMVGDAVMLTPWRSEEHERWDLNLFAAKPDLAALMEVQGYLTSAPREPDLGGTAALELAGRLILRLAHMAGFGPQQPLRHGDPYVTGLAAYEAWLDPARTAAERYGALRLSLTTLRGVCALNPTPGRLATLARVALEAGERHTALQALTGQGRFRQPPHGEPFLAVSPRFDRINPGEDQAEWFTAQVLEQGELLGAYSSFYRASHAENLAWLCADSFASAEMIRRLVLQHVQAGSTHTEALQALLDARRHLNAEVLRPERLKELAAAGSAPRPAAS